MFHTASFLIVLLGAVLALEQVHNSSLYAFRIRLRFTQTETKDNVSFEKALFADLAQVSLLPQVHFRISQLDPEAKLAQVDLMFIDGREKKASEGIRRIWEGIQSRRSLRNSQICRRH